MSVQELEAAEAQTVSAFKSSVEDLALDELSRLEADRDDLAARLAVVTTAIKEVRSVLQATRPKPPPAEKKKKGSAPRVSEAGRQEVLDWLATQNGAEVTVAKLEAAFPHRSNSWAGIALNQLRDEGILRLAGNSGSTKIYKALS